MRNLFLLFIVINISAPTYAQPKVYFNFLSHNEETGQWNGVPFYTANRAKLISLANYFQLHGITYNMQSDRVYLTNVITQETPTLKLATNNKNILRWMYEDKGVEMDPHAHESVYIYPDVVKLMDSIGLPESKVIGGSIYNDSNGMNIWTNLVNGQYGIVFPNKFWKPDYMMGGGTPSHVADLKYYGFWNPQSPTSYLTHDTSSHLRHLGVGCELKIRDTSSVSSVVAVLKQVVQNVQTGLYPASGFYLQSIFFEQAELNDAAYYNKLIEIADSANAIVATGKAEWKTLKQTYTQWETVYGKQMFQWECGQTVAVGIPSIATAAVRLYPNPVTEKITIELPQNNLNGAAYRLCDLTGRIVDQRMINTPQSSIDVSHLGKGMYFIRINDQEQTLLNEKILIQ